MRPHVELDLLGQPQLVVQQSRQPVASPGPRLDLEVQGVAVRLGAELDLACFQVTGLPQGQLAARPEHAP